MGRERKSRKSTGNIDREIIKSLGEGLKTYYRLQLDTGARVQYSLHRLENRGLIGPYNVKTWGPPRLGREKRLWGLTVKGFIEFLSQNRKSCQLILQAAEAYENLLTYETVSFPERSWVKGERNYSFIEPPQYTSIPLLPIWLQKVFRGRLGDDIYTRCLTYPMLETDLPRRDEILKRTRSGFKRGRTSIPSEAKYSFTAEQQELAQAFTLRFLSNVFLDVFGNTSKAFRTPFPDRKAYEYLETLLTEEIMKLEEREQRLTTIQDRILRFFNSARKEPVEIVCGG
jgi:hypothetical protein